MDKIKANNITRILIISYFIFVLLYIRFGYFFNRIQCPFYKITGIKCAGCGATRAIKSVVLGDFKSAFSYNALAVLALPILIVSIFSTKLLAFLDKKPYSLVIIFIVIGFFVIRITSHIFHSKLFTTF